MVSGRLSPDESTTSTPRMSPDPGVRVPRARARDIVQLAEQAGDILARAREAALAPGTKKVLRKFNLKEVAEIVGVSAKTITRAVQRNELPPGERVRGNRLLFTLQEIHEIQERLALRPWRDAATDKAVVVAIANFKGGVGKTSTAIHLGQYFALRGYRVLGRVAQEHCVARVGHRVPVAINPWIFLRAARSVIQQLIVRRRSFLGTLTDSDSSVPSRLQAASR